MKVGVYSVAGEKIEEIELPQVFNTPVRVDLIKRAVVAQQSHRLQPYGTDRLAGKRTSAESWGPGHGVSRVPRVKGSRHPSAGRAAFIPSAVGGRRAFPPLVERKLAKKINKKERRLAIASALAATAIKELVAERGHKIEEVKEIPLVVEDEFQKLTKAKEVEKAFEALGVATDIERAKEKKIRAGKGKRRGRKYRRKKSVLIVVSKDEGIGKGAGNFPGVDVVLAKDVSAEDLAPGTHAGRLCIFTKSALQVIEGRFS